jgi:hypothetical protein
MSPASKRRWPIYFFRTYIAALLFALAFAMTRSYWTPHPCVSESDLEALPVGLSEAEITSRFGKSHWIEDQSDGTRHMHYIECFSGGYHDIELGRDGKYTGRFDHFIRQKLATE